MRILFICSEYPPFPCGGIGIFTKELAAKLAMYGHFITVIGLYNVPTMQVETLEGVKVIRLPRRKSYIGNALNRLTLYLRIRKIVKEEKIDIIELPDFTGLLGFLPKLSCKVIVRMHGSVYYFNKLMGQGGWKKYLWKYIEKSNFRKADFLISVSDYTANLTRYYFNLSQNIVTIYNGISVNEAYTKKNEFEHIRKFIYAGSLIRKKGVLELIDAWIRFEQMNKNIELHLFGKDVEGLSDIIKNKLLLLNCTSVFVNPPVDKSELLNLYKHADYCIYPSKFEAFALAPMEAMSMSKVVLYTQQTSANEIIQHMENGILIENATADAIFNSLMLVNDFNINTYNEIAFKAYMTIYERFNFDVLFKENIEFYMRIITDED